MIQIANVPYQRTYKFAPLSDAFLLKYLLYLLALLLPFFIVYSVNNFYQSFADVVTAGPILTYDYNYHLTIETETSLYTYSTVQSATPGRPITFTYEHNPKQNLHRFEVEWQKKVSERVRRVSLVAFLSYTTAMVSKGYGMVVGEGTGYDIGELSVVGTAGVAKGLNLLAEPPTSSILVANNYDIGATLLQLQSNYKTYLKSNTQSLSFSMPSNQLKFSFTLRTQSHSFEQVSPSVLGQLVWSFRQYFPIALVFWVIATVVLTFLLREGLLRRTIIHDRF